MAQEASWQEWDKVKTSSGFRILLPCRVLSSDREGAHSQNGYRQKSMTSHSESKPRSFQS